MIWVTSGPLYVLNLEEHPAAKTVTATSKTVFSNRIVNPAMSLALPGF
jgi:hypothetical protein